jgi:hypothetical protein
MTHQLSPVFGSIFLPGVEKLGLKPSSPELNSGEVGKHGRLCAMFPTGSAGLPQSPHPNHLRIHFVPQRKREAVFYVPLCIYQLAYLYSILGLDTIRDCPTNLVGISLLVDFSKWLGQIYGGFTPLGEGWR